MPGKKLPKIEGPPTIVDPRPIKEIELEVFERFTGGRNPMGWKAWGRDEDGTAMLYCVQPGRIRGEPVMLLHLVKITKEGLVHMRGIEVDDDAA